MRFSLPAHQEGALSEKGPLLKGLDLDLGWDTWPSKERRTMKSLQY